MRKKILAGIVVLIGIGIIAFPGLRSMWEKRQQDQLLAQYKEEEQAAQESVQASATPSPTPEPTATPTAQATLMQGATKSTTATPDAASVAATPKVIVYTAAESETVYDPLFMEFLEDDESAAYDPDAEYRGMDVEYDEATVDGILGIEAIDLELPVIKGATYGNMRISVTSFTNGGTPGGFGNYSIAGHRNREYGRNFNRLDEVAEGDMITMTTKTDVFKYTVVDTLFVDPDAVWVLDGDPDVKEITLITCHPMGNPTGRMIVKGRILDADQATQ